MSDKYPRVWTDEETARLQAMHAEGAKPGVIGMALGVTSQAVAAKLRYLAAGEKKPVRGRPWSDNDEFVLSLMHRLGFPPAKISEVLGRSNKAIATHVSRVGISDPVDVEERNVGPRERWTADEDLLLGELADRSWEIARIAGLLGRTPSACQTRMARLGIVSAWRPSLQAARQAARVRPCMCCGRKFRSEGIHNRLCQLCKDSDLVD